MKNIKEESKIILQALNNGLHLFFHPKVYFSKITLLSKRECRNILINNFKIGTCLFLLLIIIYFIVILLHPLPPYGDTPILQFLPYIIIIGFAVFYLFYYFLAGMIYLVLFIRHKTYQTKWDIALTISSHLSVSAWFYCLIPLFLLLQIVMFFYSIIGINSLKNVQ